MPILKNVNREFFKTWSDEMSYVLGFFAADGYITTNKRGGKFLSIQIADKKHLMLLRGIFGSEHKISKRISNGNIFYRLQIGSKEMCDDLAVLGMTPKKSHSMLLPRIPRRYLGSFVRGYFDGDGDAWVGMIHKERRTKTLVIKTSFTSCSKEFLEALRSALHKEGVGPGGFYCAKGFYRLYYSVRDSRKLYRLMYKDDQGLHISKKKASFEKFFSAHHCSGSSTG